jgi:hypothetical protein
MKNESKKWKRNCPSCGKTINYTRKKNWKRANQIETNCQSCTNTGRTHTDEAKRKISLSKIGNTYTTGWTPSEDTRQKMRDAKKDYVPWNKGKKGVQVRSQEAIEKFRKTMKLNGKLKGDNNPSKRPAVRKKLRIAMIEQRSKLHGQIHPLYNSNSIPIIEQKATELGITDLQHAENGGEFYIKELGYWVDGYSKEKNTVIEYYEKHHGRQEERDLRRQQEITDLLNCKFIIIKE